MTPDSPAPVPPDGETDDAIHLRDPRHRHLTLCEQPVSKLNVADLPDIPDPFPGCWACVHAAGLWQAGFAAGRAAATPDPHDWSAAILTLRQAMCTPAGREQVERELIRPFAASPDERLREAVAALPQYVITIQDREGYTYERGCAGQPMNYTGVMLADVEALVGRELKYDAPVARETTDELKDALREIASFDAAGDARFDYRDVIRVKEIAAAALAADREKPDKPHTQDCQDAMFMHHAATGGDMECTCRPPVSDDPTGITRPTPEPDRRARFGRIAPHVSDDPVNDPETNT